MQHLIDLTLSDYCARLILLVLMALDAATTLYALHHQPAGGKTVVVEGNPIVAALMRFVGPEGAMLLTKAFGIALTYWLTPIWPAFLFGGAAVLAWFVFSNVRVIRAGAALALLLGLILLAPRPALAGDLVMHLRSPGSELRLYDTPCAVPALLDQLKDEYRDKFKAARASVNGHAIAGCWIEEGESAMLIFENGETMALPLDKFSDQTT